MLTKQVNLRKLVTFSWARRAFTCCPECGLASIASFPLSSCLQSVSGRIQGPLGLGFFLVAVSASGRAAHGPTSLFISLTFSSSHRSATRLSRSPTWSPLTQLSHPWPRGPGTGSGTASSRLLWELCLGCRGHGFLLGRHHN